MSTEKYIVFKLKGQNYAASIQQIVTIERLQQVVALPQASSFIDGITELRGEVIPVIDLKSRMDLPRSESTEHSRMLVSPINDVQVGFVVDEASDVIDIDDGIIEAAPTTIKGVNGNFLHGVAKLEDRLLLLLDLEHVLNYEEVNEVKQVVQEK
ncbi:chemotaxis protein CheW [Paraliobacillus ryukyuensis]|uniref:Purine-binding chemotaxis protein CheW n=1 Tax=Paraliobacillus ryukyuensis TaxID=200904 RepID=A0A366E9G0_9BACI|nr:chemotaxis protein CheW [Paraliobacillus ryukyuensis]RBO98048.1 purine-binding chemotaxis protein CheW [Paraliobacillus ryukyuensis]